MMSLLVTLFWWAVKIFLILLVLVIIANAIIWPIFFLSEKHPGGKADKAFSKMSDAIGAIESAPSNLEKKMDAKFDKINAGLGDLDAICNFYGFNCATNDVKSKEYGEMLKALNKVREQKYHDTRREKMFRDIVLNKLLYDENAEQHLSAATPKEADFIRNHRIFEKSLKDGDIPAARNALAVLKTNDTLPIDPRLLGIFFYGTGALYENGEDGYERNIKKACRFYRKAALDYSVTEAMLPLGMILITGEAHGITVGRDYCTANTCIFRAAKAGNAEAKKLLDTYGVGGVILRPIKEGPITYRFLYGYELTASVELVKYLHMMFGITSKVEILENLFSDEYSAKFKSFEQLVSGIDTLYIEYIKHMLNFGIQVLMSYGIDEYDVDALIDANEDLNFSERASYFINSLEQIDAKARQMNLDIEYAKATRARWTGAGFGTTIGSTIKASVKASVTAGIMNAGTGVLYDIGGSIAKGKNNAEIQQMQKNLFNNTRTKWELVRAVHGALADIGITVLKILERHSIVNYYGLEGKVIYQGQNFSEIDDRVLDSKINNNRESGNTEYLYALLLEKLRRNPFDDSSSAILDLNCITTANGEDSTATLVQLAGDFGQAGLPLDELPFQEELPLQ